MGKIGLGLMTNESNIEFLGKVKADSKPHLPKTLKKIRLKYLPIKHIEQFIKI
jgi:hypothetical protein